MQTRIAHRVVLYRSHYDNAIAWYIPFNFHADFRTQWNDWKSECVRTVYARGERAPACCRVLGRHWCDRWISRYVINSPLTCYLVFMFPVVVTFIPICFSSCRWSRCDIPHHTQPHTARRWSNLSFSRFLSKIWGDLFYFNPRLGSGRAASIGRRTKALRTGVQRLPTQTRASKGRVSRHCCCYCCWRHDVNIRWNSTCSYRRDNPDARMDDEGSYVSLEKLHNILGS